MAAAMVLVPFSVMADDEGNMFKMFDIYKKVTNLSGNPVVATDEEFKEHYQQLKDSWGRELLSYEKPIKGCRVLSLNYKKLRDDIDENAPKYLTAAKSKCHEFMDEAIEGIGINESCTDACMEAIRADTKCLMMCVPTKDS